MQKGLFMTWKTHVIGGAQAGVALAAVCGGNMTESAVLFSCSVLGSLLPDVDYPGSKLARSDGFVGLSAKLLSKITKHRGFTHTIPGALAFAAVFYLLAMMRSEKEGLLAFFAALAIFLVFHATGDALRYLAGWFAAGTYLFGPGIAEAIAEHRIDFGLDQHSAFFCALGIFAGCLMHIAYDAFNKGGVMLLYPLSRKTYRVANIKTNTIREMEFAMLQIIILITLLAILFREVNMVDAVEKMMFELRSYALS